MAERKDYRVGVYVRLSKEDSRAGESVSIENQKLMLTKHVNDMGWELREIYQDDGFSGTNQNRPAFQRMLADVKNGFINTILIKDLSRLGRNYLEVGNLAEVFLPEHGCELISLNEKLDDMMVFRNWFNEQHSKSTSAKVRASRRICAENGKFLGPYAPYGFKKDPHKRHLLVPDEATAPIVRVIFELRAFGKSFRAIAAQLNSEGITSPREYYYQVTGRKNPCKTNRLWSESTVKDITANEVYIGNLVQGKSGTISYKNRTVKSKPKDEWIRVEAAHEPLIARDLWDRVQDVSSRRLKPRRRNDGEKNLFTGLLFCADCGCKLRGRVERSVRKNGSEYKYVSYMCGTYAHCGKNACSIHSINEKALRGLIIDGIRADTNRLEYNETSIIEKVMSSLKNDAVAYSPSYESELAIHRKQIAGLDLLIESLYTDKVNGLVPDSLFKRLIIKYERDRNLLSRLITALELRVKGAKQDTDIAFMCKNLIKRYSEPETLVSEALLLLVDKIIVSEARLVDGARVCDVRIVYNYACDDVRLNDDRF